ncbi:hypothetical protein [Occallatibacter riparius]|uniref:Uncharacterized protein n=1 Tax=Occallatibacter riparius TaxID=1002689 RepID=A0A9J7BV96_9BACT|nr:hypothetical protein [Occallatibacter riparius]UWZ84830.1 hypothetical protein MOP44_02570 [Occallatibacter riparius]
MAEDTPSRTDVVLERLSKIAGILVPVVIAAVGAAYTIQKDNSDKLSRDAQEKQDTQQRIFDNAQKRYANLAALLPLLTSDKADTVKMAVEVYTAETKDQQAPTELQVTILQLPNKFPELASVVRQAADAGREQQKSLCSSNPDGLYIQVANSTEQLDRGRGLASSLNNGSLPLPLQGVQRIDQGPLVNQLRYYFSPENNDAATKVIDALKPLDVGQVQKQDLSPRYLKAGCAPPRVFELWIGTSTPLAPQFAQHR